MRDTEKRGMGDKNVGFFSLSLSLSASKFLNGSQTLIIFHSVTAITCGEGGGETGVMKSTWH